MKKILIIITIAFINIISLKSQLYWTIINDVNSGCTILNKNSVFIIGRFGFITQSIDNGLNWNLLNSNTSRNLNSIVPISDNKLIIVGDYGTILTSFDKGNNWKKIQTNFNINLKSVCSFDSLNILIVGDSGLILKSVDGGNNFSKVKSNTISNLFKIKISSDRSATIIGEKGSILLTNDSGFSWEFKLNQLSEYLSDIDFFNSKIGTISSNEGLLRTNDSGHNWVELKQTDSKNNYFSSIKHLSPDSLISISNVVRISNDSGKTWVEINDILNLEQSNFINSIEKYGNLGLLVGNKILITNDYFKTFLSISKIGVVDFFDLIAFDNTSLFISGRLNSYGNRSFDLGLTWKTTNRSYLSVDKFIQISQDSAIAFSFTKNFRNDFRGWVTGDKGDSWGYFESNFNLPSKNKNSNFTFKNVSFANRNNAILNIDMLFYSKDGYVNWDTAKVDILPNRGYWGLFLVNDTLGFASSRSVSKNLDSSITTTNRIYKTIDGGMNWVTINQVVSDFDDSVEFKNFFFKDSLEGFAVGQNANNGAVLHHTFNGGIEWVTTQFKGVKSLNNIKFFNNNIGYLLGSQGNLFSTSDGGKSWVKEKLWYEDLIDSTFNLEDIYIMPNRKTLFLKLRIGNNSSSSIYRKTLTNQIPISSVNEQKIYNFISDISPNPTNNYVNIKCESFLNKEVDVKLFNAISEEVFSGKFINSTNGISINISNIPNGFYNVIIKAGDKRSFQKVIVKH